MKKQLIFVALLFISVACSNKPKISKRIKPVLASFALEIKAKDSIRLQKITTKKGYESIMHWSNSLNNTLFVNDLVADFENFNVFSVTDNDSIVILSMGNSDNVIGASGGYVFLKKKGDSYKIDLFRGGK